ncbi:hypothetical protein EON81_22320 [bacterium]|nr:MAG: hypothetical protein EON81_22320 [bacterium]
MLATCDVAIGDLGTNDHSLGLAAWQNTIYLAAASIGRSVRTKTIFLSTIGPRTSSTDSWATVTNQTPSSSSANRLLVNTWMRSILPGLLSLEGVTCYVFDGLTVNAVNALGQPDVAGLYWNPSRTTDGLHPGETGHAAAAVVGRAALQAAGLV